MVFAYCTRTCRSYLARSRHDTRLVEFINLWTIVRLTHSVVENVWRLFGELIQGPRPYYICW